MPADELYVPSKSIKPLHPTTVPTKAGSRAGHLAGLDTAQCAPGFRYRGMSFRRQCGMRHLRHLLEVCDDQHRKIGSGPR